jgi:cell division protein FtsB
MNIEQIMALADEYSTYPGHPVMRKDLQAAIEALVQERDALKNQLETANSGWYDKLLEATLERDALRDTLQDVRGHYERVCKERDKLAMENKTLRDALEYVLETCDWHGDDGLDATSKARAALTRSKS